VTVALIAELAHCWFRFWFVFEFRFKV